MGVDVKLFLICCLPLISFGQAKTKPVLNTSIDGNLNRTEWLRSKDMGFYNFDFGRCYSRVSGDSLLMAFDIITDNTNDPSADFLQLYFDTNHDGLLGEGDLVMEANTGNHYLLSYHKCKNCDETSLLRVITPAVAAAGFGLSFSFNTYAHKTWELAIPKNQLPATEVLDFAFTVRSGFPYISKTTLLAKDNRFTGEIKLVNGRILDKEIATTAVDNSTRPIYVVRRRVLEGMQVETTYSDSSKMIVTKGGKFFINPDGKKSGYTYLSTPRLVPPVLPAETKITDWLNEVNNSLIELIKYILNGDTESLNLFQQGEAGLKLYEIVNRRIDLINYLNSRK